MSNAKFGAKEVMDVVLYDMETKYTQEAVRATPS